METFISKGNTKLGTIPSVSLPTTVCRADAPCKKGCYANKGRFKLSSTSTNYINNLACYIHDSEKYFEDIINYVNNKFVSYKFFRWHASGDIVNNDYLLGMIKVANACKNTTFLCYTKKFNIVNDYIKNGGILPKNLTMVFSAWNKDFIVDNPYNLPVAYVKFCKSRASETPNIPANAKLCPGHCETCGQICWHLKKNQSVYFNQH